MKFSFWSAPLVLIILLFYACGPADPNEKIVKGIKEEVVKNYENNKPLFDKLDDYFKLTHIKAIEFLNDRQVNIRYATDSSKGTGDYKSLQNQDSAYTALKNAISLDNLTSKDLWEIKKHLQAINVSSMVMFNFYDEKTGLKSKGIELNYNANTPYNFCYRHFEKPLEGMQFVSKETMLYNISDYEKLGDRTLYYIR